MKESEKVDWKSHPERLDPDFFAEIFYHDLESWFSADIACCDACHDAYARMWPGITNSIEFQTQGIPLDCFYSGSRNLPDMYTEEEFQELCKQMICPQCGKPLGANIWPYNFKFDVPSEFESQVEQVKNRAIRTPFLLLRHPLARRVLKEIRKIMPSSIALPLNITLFRARQIDTLLKKEEFLAPPATGCVEGRYNHCGHPVLYVASSPKVAFKEIGSPPEGAQIAEIFLKKSLSMLDLGSDELPSDILQAITRSALLSAPTKTNGWEKPEYIFSRFVADCAIDSGFSVIRYPSVATPDGFNMAIFSNDNTWADVVSVGEITKFHPASQQFPMPF